MATLRHDVPTLMDGWLFKEGKSFLRSRTRRYFRLKGTVLSNHHSPGSPASWEASVISCPVTAGAREHELVVALPTRQMSFFAETATDFAAWVDALRTASARSLEDYYIVGEVLGEGSFAKVHRGVDRETGEEVAIKIVSKAGYTARELEYVVREVAIMRELDHPNVVTTYDIFETVTHLHLVIELCEGGELFDIVADHGHLSERNASHVMRSIVSGIEYLHSQGICHRDIKPENILVKSKTWPLEVKLADFGLANFVEAETALSPGSSSSSASVDPAAIRPMATVIGTPGYVAPEVIKRTPYGPPVDMWAAGVVLYIILSGKMPFFGRTDAECMSRIANAKYALPAREWGRISPDAISLLRGLLQLNADKRLTAAAAMQHAWLADPAALSTEPLDNNLRGLHSTRRKFRRAVMAALTVHRMRGALMAGGGGAAAPGGGGPRVERIEARAGGRARQRGGRVGHPRRARRCGRGRRRARRRRDAASRHWRAAAAAATAAAAAAAVAATAAAARGRQGRAAAPAAARWAGRAAYRRRPRWARGVAADGAARGGRPHSAPAAAPARRPRPDVAARGRGGVPPPPPPPLPPPPPVSAADDRYTPPVSAADDQYTPPVSAANDRYTPHLLAPPPSQQKAPPQPRALQMVSSLSSIGPSMPSALALPLTPGGDGGSPFEPPRRPPPPAHAQAPPGAYPPPPVHSSPPPPRAYPPPPVHSSPPPRTYPPQPRAPPPAHAYGQAHGRPPPGGYSPQGAQGPPAQPFRSASGLLSPAATAALRASGSRGVGGGASLSAAGWGDPRVPQLPPVSSPVWGTTPPSHAPSSMAEAEARLRSMGLEEGGGAATAAAAAAAPKAATAAAAAAEAAATAAPKAATPAATKAAATAAPKAPTPAAAKAAAAATKTAAASPAVAGASSAPTAVRRRGKRPAIRYRTTNIDRPTGVASMHTRNLHAIENPPTPPPNDEQHDKKTYPPGLDTPPRPPPAPRFLGALGAAGFGRKRLSGSSFSGAINTLSPDTKEDGTTPSTGLTVNINDEMGPRISSTLPTSALDSRKTGALK
ncbi:hypothetical protein BU14_0306s0027 [Porphyra umbilicalis]|uniref:Protein kinase domain-containing protein n=1 Tax=Porphyra umbilicalis TaxID=2786 RepID=A0A1X6NZW0_PORUM|nr:hypothetical protein BU14_0306s0027 [Porphyra umbilicalis]|eukprot:OSX74149.1 hypothetical protein BU14_0306s0027 [Porphyra umbilicalis]